MLFTAGLIASLLLAPAVLAYPYHDENRTSHLLTRDSDNQTNLFAGAEHWGDAQGTFTGINVTFNTPHVMYLEHPFSVKIGLDNLNMRCQNAYIHTGVEITPDHDGKASYRGYFLWNPSKKGYFENLSVSAGHDITFSIKVALTPITSAVIIAKDEYTGTSDAVLLQAPSPNAICAEAAVLLVERDSYDKPIADFGRVVFKNINLGSTNSAIDPYTLDWHLYDLILRNNETKATTVQELDSFVVLYV